MSDNEKTPVGNEPEENNSGSSAPFSASEDVDRILSDILGADGSYKDNYNTVFTRYNGMPASPAPVMRRHEVNDVSEKQSSVASRPVSPIIDRDRYSEAADINDIPPRSRDGELSYRERYARMYGEPMTRRRVNEPDYPQYSNRYPYDSRRRSDVNRLPTDVNRIFEDAQREAQSPDISLSGVKYPTLGSNQSGERVIYDADWEERAQREAAEELQRRMRNPQYDYSADRRNYYDSDFVAGGVSLSGSRRQGQGTGRINSLIDPLTQDDSLYARNTQQKQKKQGRDDKSDSDISGEKKPFFSQGFPVNPANNSGIANGETKDYAYDEHDAVLESFSEDYSNQNKRMEQWKQPVEKAEKRKKKGPEKRKTKRDGQSADSRAESEQYTNSSVQSSRPTAPAPQSVPQPSPVSAEPTAADSAKHAVFPSEDEHAQDIAGTLSIKSQVKQPVIEKRVVAVSKNVKEPSKKTSDGMSVGQARTGADNATSKKQSAAPNTQTTAKQAAAAEQAQGSANPKADEEAHARFIADIHEQSEDEFFENRDFDSISIGDENGVDKPVLDEHELFDLGVFDEEKTDFVFPENFESRKKGRLKTFIYNNFPNKDDSKLNVLRKIIMDVSFVAFVCAAIYLGVYYVNYREQIAEGHELESIAGEYNTNYSDEELEDLWSDIHAQYPDVVFPDGMNIKFAKLYAVNQDVVGWLTVPNKQISSVIVQADNNSYYLYRDYFGSSNRYGNPYADYRCALDAKGALSKNTIIYGHNMRDGLVFASLLDYTEIEGYKNSPVIEFDTLFETTYWKVFGVMLTNVYPADDNGQTFEYLYTNYGSDEAFMNIVDGIRLRSMIHTEIDVQPTDKMLMLYTCYNTIFKNGRLVIAARQVREGESKDVDTSTAYFNYNARYPQAYYSAFNMDNPYSTADDNVNVTQSQENETQAQQTAEAVTGDAQTTQSDASAAVTEEGNEAVGTTASTDNEASAQTVPENTSADRE